MVRQIKKCFCDSLRVLWGVLLVGIMALLLMKSCIWFALKHDEIEVIKDLIPVIEKLVWPIFLIVIIFLFKRQVSLTLAQLPGLVRRSLLPGSPPNQPELKSTSLGENIAELPKVETESSQSGENSKSGDAFSEEKHQGQIKNLFLELANEYGVKIVPEVAVLGSSWRADGAFLFGNRFHYIAVLPYKFRERIQNVIKRVNDELSRHSQKVDFALMICLYGADSIDVTDLTTYRYGARFDVVLRMFKDEINAK